MAGVGGNITGPQGHFIFRTSAPRISEALRTFVLSTSRPFHEQHERMSVNRGARPGFHNRRSVSENLPSPLMRSFSRERSPAQSVVANRKAEE
jgi:hypothetical protein